MKFLADEDFDNRIIRGLLRRYPDLDVVRVQDTDISSGSDPEVLEWAAQQNRILLSHDVNTMTYYFRQRMEKGLPSPGIIFARQSLPIGFVIDELGLITQFSLEGEYQNQIKFIPFD